MNKKIPTTIAISIVLISAILAGGFIYWRYFNFQEELSNQPDIVISEKPIDETADGGIYRNMKYGFEFEVPSVFEENGYQIEIGTTTEGYFPFEAECVLLSFKTKPIEPYFGSMPKDKYENMFFIKLCPQDYCLRNDGEKVCEEIKTDEKLFIRYLTENNEFFAIYSSLGPSDGDFWDAAGWYKDEVRDGVEKILSTFKFIEEDSLNKFILISPNGGEVWEIGKTYKIDWEQPYDVSIWLEDWLSAPTKTYMINDNVAAPPYFWTIPSSIPLGTKYKIVMRAFPGVKGATLSDSSDDFFSIIKE